MPGDGKLFPQPWQCRHNPTTPKEYLEIGHSQLIVQGSLSLKDGQYFIKWYDAEQLPQSSACIISKKATGASADDMNDEFFPCSSNESDDDRDDEEDD